MSFSSFRRKLSKNSGSSQQPDQSPYQQNTSSYTRNDPNSNSNFKNPFTTSDETLVNQSATTNPATLSQDTLRPTDLLPPTDLAAENETATERWRFRRRDHKTSAPASDVGEDARHTSVDDRSEFAKLMLETAGMTPEEVKMHLRNRENPHYRKVEPEGGYFMLTGAFGGMM